MEQARNPENKNKNKNLQKTELPKVFCSEKKLKDIQQIHKFLQHT